MKNKIVPAVIGAVVIIGIGALIAAFSFKGRKPEEPAAPPTEEIEDVTDVVENPNAYEEFQQSVEEGVTEENLGGAGSSGIYAEYDYTSSMDTERERNGDQVRSYLTGKWVPASIGDRRPVAVMLNNIIDAQPMCGVTAADVLYECVVEGSLTRMMGIFENYDDLEKIGSVRSCRNYFVYFALEFDAIYCHYGQSAYAMPLLEQPFVNNLSGLSAEGDTVYYRTTDRVAPHNAYASAKGIKKGIEDLGYDNAYPADYHGKFTFAKDGDIIVPDSPDSYDATRVEPGYLINKPWFEYHEDDQKYYRFQYGGPQIDEMNGQQLAVDNLILQYCGWEHVDENYLGFNCHAGGKMTYITHGKARDGSWIRFGGDQGHVRYFDAEGREIVLNQGKTWVEIVQDTEGDKVVVQ
ncbi:MAG: DUF3048 domain-containing protein [Lachnospiraceae bacterium]|nr:DUF3048 domain-containing protein [Lachnospiraceae bacterium]